MLLNWLCHNIALKWYTRLFMFRNCSFYWFQTFPFNTSVLHTVLALMFHTPDNVIDEYREWLKQHNIEQDRKAKEAANQSETDSNDLLSMIFEQRQRLVGLQLLYFCSTWALQLEPADCFWIMWRCIHSSNPGIKINSWSA